MTYFKLNKQLSEVFLGADELKERDFKEVDYLVDQLIQRGTLCALLGEPLGLGIISYI